jgi:hypothetical protein
MHRRAVRFTLLAFLLASSFVAAYLLQDLERRSSSVLAAADDVEARLTRLGETFAQIGAAQHSYLSRGPADQQRFERVAVLVAQLYDDTAALKPLLRSPASTAVLQALARGTDALVAADARARENLRLGQELMAEDVIFSDSRSTLEAMNGRLREIRDAEHAERDVLSAAIVQERWSVFGAAALLWLVGLVALVPTARGQAAPSSLVVDGRPDDVGAANGDSETLQAIDLTAAADLCTALSRVTSAAALPDLLRRAASLLDARGIILWLGAGQELFAATAHGYQPHTLARLGPIPRAAENATAAAWRNGAMTTVPGDRTSAGAIVAPMFGPEACIGVLAVEVRPGRERDSASQAVAAMIAAQLAAAVAAWPAASPVHLRSASM